MNWYKIISGRKIPGGRADGKVPSDFNQTLMEEGVEVEKEHTNDKEIAQEITMDHLEESPQYYKKLKEMEKGL